MAAAMLLWGREAADVHAAQKYDVTEERFGADGHDTDPDTEAIQRALGAAAGAKEMVTVSIPAGDYYIDQPLRIYSNTHLLLDKGAVIHRTSKGIDRMMLHNVDRNGKMDETGGYDMSENILVEGGTWDGGDTSKASDGADILRFDHATGIEIRDCTVKNVYDCHLIELVGVKNGVVTGCRMSGFRYRKGKENNYLFAREAIQIESAWTNDPSDLSPDSEDAWANGSVVDGTACENIEISDNQLQNMPCGMGQHHYTEDGKYRNAHVVIRNNRLQCSASMKNCKTAITCGGMNDVKIQNNTVEGAYRFALHVTEADGVLVSGNKISGSSYNGIMVDGGKKTVLEGNTIQKSAKHGISVLGGITERMSGNKFKDIKQDGIAIDKGTVKVIRKNTFKTMGKHAISIVGGTVGVGRKSTTGLLDNTIEGCSQNGISISGGVVPTISRNKISNVKNNGISITGKAKVYLVKGNTLRKCRGHAVWSGSTAHKTVVKDNRGQK